MKVTFGVDGMEEVQDALSSIAPREARRVLQRTTAKIAADIRTDARAAAPVRTKRLRKAIKSKRDKGTRDSLEASVRVGKKGFYWRFLEFGTRTQSARPFLLPALERARSRLPVTFQQEFWVQFKRELEKRAKKTK